MRQTKYKSNVNDTDSDIMLIKYLIITINYSPGIRPVLELLLREVEQTPAEQWQRLESMFFCSSCVIKILSRSDTDIVMR